MELNSPGAGVIDRIDQINGLTQRSGDAIGSSRHCQYTFLDGDVHCPGRGATITIRNYVLNGIISRRAEEMLVGNVAGSEGCKSPGSLNHSCNLNRVTVRIGVIGQNL